MFNIKGRFLKLLEWINSNENEMNWYELIDVENIGSTSAINFDDQSFTVEIFLHYYRHLDPNKKEEFCIAKIESNSENYSSEKLNDVFNRTVVIHIEDYQLLDKEGLFRSLIDEYLKLIKNELSNI